VEKATVGEGQGPQTAEADKVGGEETHKGKSNRESQT